MRTPDQNTNPNLLDNCLNGFTVAECHAYDETTSLVLYIPGMGQSVLHGALGLTLEPPATLGGGKITYDVQNATDYKNTDTVSVEAHSNVHIVPIVGMRPSMHLARITPNPSCSQNGSNATSDSVMALPVPISVHVTGDLSFVTSMTTVRNPHDALLHMALQEMHSIAPVHGPYTFVATDASGVTFTCTTISSTDATYDVLGAAIDAGTCITTIDKNGVITLNKAVTTSPVVAGDTFIVYTYDHTSMPSSIDASKGWGCAARRRSINPAPYTTGVTPSERR